VTEKAKHAAKLLNCTVLVDDTSLELNALGGLPGPYIKAFVDKIGPDGLVRLLHGFEDKTAASQCIFALCEPNGEPKLFVGRTNGTIVQARGPTHFGFDPCFQPEGSTKTFAEMDASEKNLISHRGRALRALSSFFQTSNDDTATSSNTKPNET